jgi:hypothetical protein
MVGVYQWSTDNLPVAVGIPMTMTVQIVDFQIEK